MATKKPTSRRKTTKTAKKKKEDGAEEPVVKSEKSKSDNPIKGAAALGIVAVLIGLTIGGYIASRYFDPPTQDLGVPEDLVEQLAAQLADDMVKEREAVNIEERKGIVKEIVEDIVENDELSDVEDGDETADELVVTKIMQYVNGYYGISFIFPASWIFDGNVEIIENQTRLGVLSSDKVELVVSAVDFSELSFKRAVRKLFTTEDRVIDDVEETVRRYTELNPDEEPLAITPADVDFGNEEFSLDNHDAFVDWYTEPVLDGEPRAVVRQYWVNGGGGTMYHLRFTYPVFEPTEELVEDPYLGAISNVISSFNFTNDGIADDFEEVVVEDETEG